MKRIIYGLIGLALLFSSCNNHIFYSDIQTLPKEKWATNKPLTFTVDIPDSMAYYNMYFNVRNTTSYEYQNFYVFMQTQYPDGHVEQDTLGFILCDKLGKWTGDGQGRIKSNKFLFQPNMRFPFTGKYTFTVTQGMRTDAIEGISDFGITLEAASPKAVSGKQ